MPNNEEYWINRAENRILNAEKNSDELLKDMKKLYEDTIKKINKEIEAFIGRYSTKEGLTIQETKKLLTSDELKQFRKDALEYYADLSKHVYDPAYRNKLKAQIYSTLTKDGKTLYSLRRNISRLDNLKMQLQFLVENMYMKENEAFTNKLSKVYEETYMRSMFDSQQAVGVYSSFNSLNTPIVQKTVQEKWLGENYSSRIWNDKNKLIDTLETTFAQGVATGKNPRVIAREISKKMDTKYSNCERLARTEFNHIANKATMDSYEATDGLDKYKYVATLDSRTSEICQNLDGKVFLISEAEEGVNYPSMHPHCYDKDTEVYTNNGWKLFKDCTIEDLYYSLNPETLKSEFVKAKNMINYEHNGEMCYFYNNHFDLCVTPEHQMLLKYDGKDGSGKLRFQNANKMPKTNNSIPRGILWEGEKIDFVELGGYKISIELYLKFMGWYLSEGSCTKVKNKNSYRVKISQKKYLKEMYETLKELPFKITLTKEAINCYDYNVCKDLERYGKSYEKFVPEIIKELNSDLIKIFLNAYIMGDGSNRKIDYKNGNFENEKVIHTSSNKMMNDLTELILKAGGRPSFKLVKSKGKLVKHRNGIYIGNHNIWTIRWCTKQWASVSNLKRDLISYNDYVYCVELEKYHTLLVRRNGKICWCGNCRSTTIPYFEDEDYSKMERIATNPKTGASYYVPANMTYAEWKASLSEEQGKYFVAKQKSKAQYKSDLKQLREYKKLASQSKKQGYGDLFNTLPSSISEFQSMKYLNPEKYEIFKENARIARNLK